MTLPFCIWRRNDRRRAASACGKCRDVYGWFQCCHQLVQTSTRVPWAVWSWFHRWPGSRGRGRMVWLFPRIGRPELLHEDIHRSSSPWNSPVWPSWLLSTNPAQHPFQNNINGNVWRLMGTSRMININPSMVDWWAIRVVNKKRPENEI